MLDYADFHYRTLLSRQATELSDCLDLSGLAYFAALSIMVLKLILEQHPFTGVSLNSVRSQIIHILDFVKKVTKLLYRSLMNEKEHIQNCYYEILSVNIMSTTLCNTVLLNLTGILQLI